MKGKSERRILFCFLADAQRRSLAAIGFALSIKNVSAESGRKSVYERVRQQLSGDKPQSQ
jgi:hypothetical protein